ncbi:phasin family protein [Zobellella denitrificans]|jgi:phasin family protein|uniref:PHA granule-associated protein n=1 Tax=Zobellella denitrificans TaxID=347534 RepID=A0A231N3C6_9GAMM|nr:phasin family protein [Zobellella denitrificans]ATG74463.1 PHA granule-associated protein [Zobellella denitrificans]OXS16376.1 phasin family protein [Zobellella denitrificans]
MYTDIFKSFNDQTEKAFGPLMKYNQLVAKNFTDLTNLQLEAARQYADIGLAQLQANSQVKDVQSLVSCGAKQLETMTRISQQMIEDGKKLADLAQEFKAGLDALAADAQKK